VSVDLQSLERKDRAELAAIAQALGGKTTSRTKKADMVQMILELSGNARATPGSRPASPRSGDGGADRDALASSTGAARNGAGGADGAEGSTGDPSRGAVGSERGSSTGDASAAADAGPAERPRHEGRPPRTASPEGDSREGETREGETREGETREGGARDGQGRQNQQNRQNRQNQQGGQSSQNRQGHERQSQQNRQNQQGGQNQQNQQGGQNQQNQQGGQNQQNRQNQQGGQGGGEDPEPGNRRSRRRRGRNRGGEEVVAPSEQQWDGEPVAVAGFLDLRDEGYGFLRVKGYLPSSDDVYVSVKQARQMGLRKGDILEGAARPANRQEKNPALLRIDKVNGEDPESQRRRPHFEDLTPLFPDQKLHLERGDQPLDMTSRIIDLIAPIGKGQRGLIVSPPKAGKTTVMKTIAQSIEANHPEVHLMVLLVDERPEEVTDMRRSVKGEVIASTFDRPSDEHTAVAELAIERAKRLVEIGKDVVIILDGITRLSRAYNLAAPATGRIMSGGIDTGALYPPKRFFGAARNVEEGGSLTILATALVETGSKMDEVIFEEFKGTGNMELRLDRRAAEKRIYPAIDVDASSTRHEELLFERTQLQQVWKLRRVLSGLAADGGNPGAGLELLIDRMRTFPNNDVFLAEIAKAPGVPS
jgi:transcription termination factor Rho